MPVVVLPSGHKAPLEPANARRLLACGGTINGLCRAVLANPDLPVEQVQAATPDDALAIASWALDEFLKSDEAVEYAGTCRETFVGFAARLGIADRVLAYEFDQGCLTVLHEAQTDTSAGRDAGFNSGVNNG